MNKIEFIIEKTKDGFSAYAVKYPIATTGDTLQELRNNIWEATVFYFEDENKTIHPENIKLSFDIAQFFEFYNVINVKAFSERIGMNSSLLYQYINGDKKPSAKQEEKILKGIQVLGQELSQVSFLVQ